jgi:hypothetical protein
VLQLLSDNLASSPQSLGDAKKESIEELQDRHERVLAATCAGLAALLDLAVAAEAPGGGSSSEEAAPGGAEQELLDGIDAQLQQTVFYKSVLQSKAAAVRRAAYRLVAAAAERRPQLLAGSVAHAAPAVLGALSDKEPANHEVLWGMLLAYARALPDSWRHVNMQKALLPRLWAFLRHGCYGSPAASYPALLPLASLLPEVRCRSAHQPSPAACRQLKYNAAFNCNRIYRRMAASSCILMQDVLGPRPAFFIALLESLWQGLAHLPSGRQARLAAAAAFQDCLLFALLRSPTLAAVGSDGSGNGGEAAGQVYCSELLQAALGQVLMPAALGGAAAAEWEAETVLTGAVAKLSQPAASSSTKQRLDLLLQQAGGSLAAALQEALAGSEQQAGSSSERLDRLAALVAALDQAAGTAGSAVLGAAVAQPLVALLLPEVRSGAAPPAASSLLAALLKAFPQHAAGNWAGVLSGAGSAASPAAARPGQPASPSEGAAVSDEFSSLRLHQSASFTIDSMLRWEVQRA